MPLPPHAPHFVFELLKRGQIRDPKIWKPIGNHLAECADCCQFYESLPGSIELSSTAAANTYFPDSSRSSIDAPVYLKEHSDWIFLGKLGEGGSGIVYLARHRWNSDELRAIKVIQRSLEVTDEPILRVIREGVTRRIPPHENLLRVFGVAASQQSLLIEMEFIPGQDLEQFAALHSDQKIPYQEVCGYILQTLKGVDHAEQNGVLHRDLKPTNLMLGLDGIVRIIDFGLAKLQLDGLDITQTAEGIKGAGSAEYMSPEQADDLLTADLRSELYSLGCTMYRLISGHPPYGPHSGHQGRKALMQAHKTGGCTSLSTVCPDVPKELSDSIDRLLSPNPRDRYGDVQAVAQKLLPFISDDERRRTTIWLTSNSKPTSGSEQHSELNDFGVFQSWSLNRPLAVRNIALVVFVIAAIITGVSVLRLIPPTKGDKPLPQTALFPKNPAGQATISDPAHPEIIRGKWSLENQELIQTSLLGGWGRHPLLTFGDSKWDNYDLSLDFQKTTEGSITICFHCDGEDERCWYSPSCYDKGRGAELAQYHKGHWERAEGNFVWQTDPPEVGKWYAVKLEIRGSLSRCFLGDHLQFEHRDPRYTKGRIGLGTWTAGCKFRNIRVTTPSGKVLWTGFPQIPTPKVVSGPATPDPYLAGFHPPLAESPFDAAQAKQYQTQWANHLQHPVEISNSVGMKLRLIPPGTFWIGSPQEEKDRLDDEVRSKRTLSRPFYIGRTEVTQGEWKAVMDTAPWKGRKYVQEGKNVPATHVSARDAEMFLEKLNDREADSEIMKQGWIYILPTEAQWEYACRAGTQTRFGFDDEDSLLGEYAWYGGVYGNGNCQDQLYAHEVKTKLPNQFGLYDMHGNLGEWCRDIYAADYYENSPQVNPQGPTTGIDRSLRGGSWYYFGNYCRSAQRNGFNPFHRSYDMGFRVALMLRPSAQSISK